MQKQTLKDMAKDSTIIGVGNLILGIILVCTGWGAVAGWAFIAFGFFMIGTGSALRVIDGQSREKEVNNKISSQNKETIPTQEVQNETSQLQSKTVAKPLATNTSSKQILKTVSELPSKTSASSVPVKQIKTKVISWVQEAKKAWDKFSLFNNTSQKAATQSTYRKRSLTL